MKISRRLTAALLAATMLGVLVGQSAVLAADPKPVVTPNKGDLLVGIADDLQGKTPEQLGYTQEYVDWKEAQAAGGQVGSPGTMAATATSGYLNGYVQYHQKKSSWCLAAMMQTILRFKQGNAWITPSVYSKQSEIYNQIGLYESAALPWINARLSGFQYLAIDPKPSLATFTSHIISDVSTFVYPTYVAAEVTHPDYIWHQAAAARHATAALGYGTSGALVRIGTRTPLQATPRTATSTPGPATRPRRTSDASMRRTRCRSTTTPRTPSGGRSSK